MSFWQEFKAEFKRQFPPPSKEELKTAFIEGWNSGARSFFDPLRPKWWKDAYYNVKNFLFPWNVVKLKRLDRSFQETDVLMEECLFQLLRDFFNGQQPFHLVAGIPYEKDRKLTVDRHRELLEELYGPAAQERTRQSLNEGDSGHKQHELEHTLSYAERMYPMYSTLLDIVEFYEMGGHRISGADVFLAATRAGTSITDAMEAEQEFERKATERLKFIIENRGHLWT